MGDNNSRGRKTPPLLPLLVCLTLSLSLSLSVSSSEYQTQTLVVKPLTHPPSLEQLDWALQEQEEIQTQTHSSDPTAADDEYSFGFTLHHIDSLAASNTTTAKELLSLRLERDALRAHSLSSLAASPRTNATTPPPNQRPPRGGLTSSVISGLSQGSGEYFTRLGIGTPPKYMYMVLDTGSDVVWIQCLPCRKCYAQTDPLFNPSHSSTFSKVPCSSPLCRKLDQPGCFRRTRSCAYQVSYGDGSFTVGEFARDTVTFRRRRSVSGIALGCGHDNEGLFVGAAGLLGLGRGKLSFPTQLGRRFSYCLVDRTSITTTTNNNNRDKSKSKRKEKMTTSSVIFGDSSVSRTASYTPLLRNPKLDTFYYVELLGLSVGGARVAGISGELFRLDAATGDGGVIIDSGTSVTRLTRRAYVALRDAFRSAAAGVGLKMASEGFSLFDTCYDLSGREVVRVPTVAMHFKGADVGLPGGNYLIPVDTEGKFCFAFAGTSGGLSIVGNLQQQGFRVVFDEVGGRVGFKPGACGHT